MQDLERSFGGMDRFAGFGLWISDGFGTTFEVAQGPCLESSQGPMSRSQGGFSSGRQCGRHVAESPRQVCHDALSHFCCNSIQLRRMFNPNITPTYYSSYHYPNNLNIPPPPQHPTVYPKPPKPGTKALKSRSSSSASRAPGRGLGI